MPKEMTHWMIAERAASLLAGTRLEKDLAAHPNCLRLGAVFPDVLFYHVGKNPGESLSSLAHALHGAGGEDTYSLLRSLLAETVTAAESGPLAAFWVGVAAHLRTDIAFHPLVYYVTGDYLDADPGLRTAAVRGHRRFETTLDMYFTRKGAGGRGRGQSLREIVARLELPLPRLLEIASRSLAAQSGREPLELKNGLVKALANFITLQGLCRRPALGAMLFPFEKLLPRTLREIASLFQAPQLAAHFGSLAKTTRYRNPVSGVEGEATVDDLFSRAAAECADFCGSLETAVIERSSAALTERGPSLSFALPRVTAKDARFFDDRKAGSVWHD